MWADALISTAREHFAVGIDPRSLIKPLDRWPSSSTPVWRQSGSRLDSREHSGRPPTYSRSRFLLITRLSARERADRLSHLLELSTAYRGTAFLLGDVVEADDAYTGAHSRDVVELGAAVADELGLDARARRHAELTALLHDVGRSRSRTRSSTSRARSPRRNARHNTHTIEGERLLIGWEVCWARSAIVRSCHERYDGAGYPDSLAGNEIPIVARIVCCCDAFNAMTTTRPYSRQAMSLSEAQAELVRNRDTQFRPRVVDALLAVSGCTGVPSLLASWSRPLRVVRALDPDRQRDEVRTARSGGQVRPRRSRSGRRSRRSSTRRPRGPDVLPSPTASSSDSQPHSSQRSTRVRVSSSSSNTPRY